MDENITPSGRGVIGPGRRYDGLAQLQGRGIRIFSIYAPHNGTELVLDLL